jgi:two-component system sensor histidine kinase UhpB
LTNIAKHAKAGSVAIKIEARDESLLLSVDDDGQGFDQHHASRGFGLAGMRERIEGLGGTFKLHSELGAGAHIKVSLPLHFKEMS